MQSEIMFLDCPEYMNDVGSVRCGLPAEVEYRYLQNSSKGLLESAKIKCPLGHWFNAPIEFLTLRYPDTADTSVADATGPLTPTPQPGS